MTGVLMRRCTGEKNHVGQSRGWRDAATHQGKRRMGSRHPKLEEAGRVLTWRLQREQSPAGPLISNVWPPKL